MDVAGPLKVTILCWLAWKNKDLNMGQPLQNEDFLGQGGVFSVIWIWKVWHICLSIVPSRWKSGGVYRSKSKFLRWIPSILWGLISGGGLVEEGGIQHLLYTQYEGFNV